jgi:hypothetical protein
MNACSCIYPPNGPHFITVMLHVVIIKPFTPSHRSHVDANPLWWAHAPPPVSFLSLARRYTHRQPLIHYSGYSLCFQGLIRLQVGPATHSLYTCAVLTTRGSQYWPVHGHCQQPPQYWLEVCGTADTGCAANCSLKGCA